MLNCPEYDIKLLQFFIYLLPEDFYKIPNKDIVKEGETGLLVPPGDAQALAEKINAILDDEQSSHEIRSRAKAHIEAMFSWDVVTKKTLEVYEQAKQRYSS